MAFKRSGVKRDPWIFLIGLFKLFKGLEVCWIIGFGLLRTVAPGISRQRWNTGSKFLRVDPENRFIHRGLVRIFNHHAEAAGRS